ncbi:MFS transporter [Candidatus Bathyarchaeota archaeon]|nr:MFS transporter [Candidatus Bathyarchaeota archaeon]
MKDDFISENKETVSSRFFVFSLGVSNFAISAMPLLVSLLLVDIGNTFGTDVGLTSQMNTAHSVAAVLFALLISAWSMRSSYRFLLVIGLVLSSVSALGCFLALDFPTMLLLYAGSGAGYVMVYSMSLALVGEHLALEKRAGAIGWVVACGAIVYFVGAPLIAVAASYGGWRFPVAAFIIPALLVSLMLALISLPSTRSQPTPRSVDWRSSLKGFREVFSNRSALACFAGDFFRASSFVIILVYAASFGRERFLHSREVASIIVLIAALCYTIGSLASGQFVKRFGRKETTVLSAFLAGLLGGSYVFMPYEAVYLPLVFAASWFFGMVTSSASSLSLEQIPSLRGTMMSIDSAAVNLGSAFGTAIGGIVLLLLDYEGLGGILGTMGGISALVFLLFSKDPTCNQQTTQTQH